MTTPRWLYLLFVYAVLLPFVCLVTLWRLAARGLPKEEARDDVRTWLAMVLEVAPAKRRSAL